MAPITIFIFYSSVFLSIFSLIKGIKNYKKLTINKILLFIPLFSTLQVIFSEINQFSSPFDNGSNKYVLLSIDLYSLIEFTIIMFFLNALFTDKNNKIKVFTLMYLGLLIAFSTSCFEPTSYFLNLKYFELFSGLSIQALITYKLIEQIKNITNDSLYANPTLISLVGIFILYILVWPASVLNEIILKDYYTYRLFIPFFISLGYSFFYIFLLISIHAESK